MMWTPWTSPPRRRRAAIRVAPFAVVAIAVAVGGGLLFAGVFLAIAAGVLSALMTIASFIAVMRDWESAVPREPADVPHRRRETMGLTMARHEKLLLFATVAGAVGAVVISFDHARLGLATGVAVAVMLVGGGVALLALRHRSNPQDRLGFPIRRR